MMNGNIASFQDYKYFVKGDLCRYLDGKPPRFRRFLRAYITPGFRYTFWMRTCQWTKSCNHPILFVFARLMLWIYSVRFGIMIPYTTQIGPGLYIAHFSCIVVSPLAVLGRNVNLSQGVTIGQKISEGRFCAPIIGDRVYVAPGAKLIGKISIGDDAAIGANAVVVKDVPAKGVAVGVPGRVISDRGSSEYVGSFFEY